MTVSHDFQARLGGAFVVVLLAIGCAVLWIGIPVACMWGAAKLTTDAAEHFVIVLPAVLVGMVLWGKALFWLNRLYVRIQLTSAGAELEEELEESDEPRWIRGPLEPLLVGTLVLALVALFVLFFAIAENPSIQVI